MPRPPFPDASTEPPRVWNIQDFVGINTQPKRSAIGDNEFSWLQNYFPIGSGNMRTLWSNAPASYTAPAGKTIVYFKMFNIGSALQAGVFFSDGTAVQVNPATGAAVTISSTVGTFYIGNYNPAVAQWNANGIVIATEATNPNGYYAWDGSTLYAPGSPAPDWLTDNTATTMPSGIHGNAIEVYGNRAWVTTPPETGGVPSTLSNSGPGNGATFSGTAGGGTTPQQDSSLVYTFTGLRQTNGFLYYFGDSATGVISNVQTATSGSSLVTTYSNQNVDPQKGTPWRATIRAFTTGFGPGIMFANPQGVHLLVGGSVQKVSSDLDGIFANADFNTLTPSAGVAIVYGISVYCLLIKTLDYQGNPIVVMCMTDGMQKGNGFRWWLATQSASLKFISWSEINSQLTCWGTDGASVYQLFAAPSAALPKIVQSKFFPGQVPGEYITYKKMYRMLLQAQDNAGTGILLTGTADANAASTPISLNSLVTAGGSGAIVFVNNSGGIIQFVNNLGEPINFTVASLLIPWTDVSCYGALMGVTLVSTSQDFTLIALTMLYSLDAPVGG